MKMDSKLSAKFVSFFLVASLCLLGYVSMNAFATSTPNYGLKIDAIPAHFNGNKTVIMDFTTIHAGIVVYPDALQARSHYYISSYSTNISSDHPSNLVSGDHCYVTIPVRNSTLMAIGEVDNIALRASNGSVTVRLLKNEPTIIKLRVNSTSTPILTVSLSGLVPHDWYQVTMDATIVHKRIYADANGSMTFSVDGPWSSHILRLST